MVKNRKIRNKRKTVIYCFSFPTFSAVQLPCSVSKKAKRAKKSNKMRKKVTGITNNFMILTIWKKIVNIKKME